MADKQTLREMVDEFEDRLPGRKNGDRRIPSPDDRALVELLRAIVEALPD